MGILFLSLGIILFIESLRCQSTETRIGQACQSGLREDNTNYIYCARQSLKKVPNSFSNANGKDTIKNVIYDELVLSDNLIGSIDKDSFANSLKAKKLYLDQNPITYIDENAFDYIRNYLEEIYFDKKSTHESSKSQSVVYDYFFDDKIFDSSKLIVDDLKIFDESVIRKCFNLRLLSIKNYNIAELKENMFSKLNKLEKLELIKLNLKAIDPTAFYGLEMNLVELNLDSNLLDAVPSHAFGALKRLRKLTLSQNRIKSLQPNAFFKISSSLSSLDLSYNNLEEIDESAFNGPIQNSLKTIFIQNNELKWTHFIQILFNLHQLQELNIDFNKLSIRLELENEESTAENYYEVNLNLISLSMQGNALTEKSLTAFDYIYDYESSKMSSSTSFMRRKFKYGKLNKLNLARNKIKYIPNKFFSELNMVQLKTLILDRNVFDTKYLSEKTFLGLENSLETLSMNSAGFKLWSFSLLKALNALDYLKVLKLNSNNATDLPPSALSIPVLKKLTSVELQNNNFIELPNFLCDLENLVDLDVSSNKIKNVNSDCLLFKLDQNRTKLRHLNLNNNPLECNCMLRELKIWLSSKYDRDLLELIKWQCAKPLRLRGKLFTNVALRDLICEKVEESAEEIDSPVILIQSSDIKPTVDLSTISITTTQTSSVASATLRDEESTRMYFAIEDSNNILSWLVLAICLGVLVFVSLLCIVVYLLCLRNRIAREKENYLTGFLQDNKRFFSESPLFSMSNSSASSTTTSVNSVYTRSSAADLIEIFGGDYFNGLLNMVNTNNKKTNMSHSNLLSSTHYYDKPMNSIVNKMLSNANLVCDSLQQQQQQQPSFEKDHLYHEITNTPNNLDRKEEIFYVKDNMFNYITNDNYLFQPNMESHYNSLCFNGNCSKLNSFNEGLLV